MPTSTFSIGEPFVMSREGPASFRAAAAGSRPRAVRAAVCCLLIGAAAIVAGPAVSRAAARPAPPAAPLMPEGDSLLPPGESGEAQAWGTVRTVRNARDLVVALPEGALREVRLLGVEPPEPPRSGEGRTPPVEGQPFGQEAVAYLRDLVMDKQVQLETYGKDRSGRTLAVVWLGDINVNLTLVKEGLAWVTPKIRVTKVRVELEVAERQAQVGKYGLWALPNPEPPWKYRRRHHLRLDQAVR